MNAPRATATFAGVVITAGLSVSCGAPLPGALSTAEEGLSVSCRAPEPGAEEDGCLSERDPEPFRWGEAALRVTPLDHRGEPTPCVTDDEARPCDIELTATGEIFYRAYSAAVTGAVGPGLSLRRPGEGQAVFTLEPSGLLAGTGLLQPPDAPQLLFCHLMEGPALRCRHELRATRRERVRNEENCAASFVARVEGGAITAAFDGHPGEPLLAARIEPPPPDSAGEALALFLYAMELVTRDTSYHRPYVDDMKKPR